MMGRLKGFLKKDEKKIFSIPLRIWSFISATWVWSLISLTWFWLLVLFTWLIGWLVIIPYIADELKKDVDRIPLTIGVIGALFIGTVGLLGLYVNYRRTVAFEEQLKIQRAQLKDQRELDKERRHQELYVASIRDLSDVGSIYGLEQLAKESEIWAPKIATIFCKYIRSTTSKADYREEENYRDEPSVEVSTMMEVLTTPSNPFDSTKFDLRYSYLVGVNIRGAKLKGANLYGINLAGAILEGADLREANLTCADLNLARLDRAKLEFAKLGGTRMIKTKLRGANLSFTDITSGAWSGVTGMGVRSSNLTGAELQKANLMGADFDADLTGAEMEGANLIGAFFGGGSNIRGANLKNVRMEGCEGNWRGRRSSIQPIEALKLKIGQNTDLSCSVGPAPMPNQMLLQDTSMGHIMGLEHQTPEAVERKHIKDVLILTDGRLTNLRGVSCDVLTQGLYDALMKDRDTNTTENEKQYRNQNSKELKPGDPDMQKMQTQLVGNNVGQCEWDNLYVWK